MRIGIIGGGIVGLAIGIAALEKKLGAITIIDKEPDLGIHASTRNSGVLHSGIYYSQDSLKAKFSVQGNEELRKIAHDAGAPVRETGKVIVSRDSGSEHILTDLMSRASRNGVSAQRRPRSELGLIIPGARTHESFIHVNRTAVGDPKAIFKFLQDKFFTLGGEVHRSNLIQKLELSDGGRVSVPGFNFEYIINAAGTNSLKLAQSLGLGLEFLTTPFLGLYWASSSREINLGVPLYPTPHPLNPFLGVHLTPTYSNLVKLGPTAIPVLGKEQYSFFSGINIKDSVDSVRAYLRIIRGDAHSFVGMVGNELPKFFRSRMIAEAAELYPDVRKVKDWSPAPGGIRAQLVNQRGELVQDFLVEELHNSIHVINAVSPGWTSALPFGRWIVETKLMQGKF